MLTTECGILKKAWLTCICDYVLTLCEVSGTVYILQVMTKLGRLYSEMIFVQGYIHCDPHPGNLLLRPSTSGTEIVLLDHGLYQVHCSLLWLSFHRLLFCY